MAKQIVIYKTTVPRDFHLCTSNFQMYLQTDSNEEVFILVCKWREYHIVLDFLDKLGKSTSHCNSVFVSFIYLFLAGRSYGWVTQRCPWDCGSGNLCRPDASQTQMAMANNKDKISIKLQLLNAWTRNNRQCYCNRTSHFYNKISSIDMIKTVLTVTAVVASLCTDQL